MRAVLLFCLLNALLEKVQELETNVELMKQCQERGLVEADSYPYLQGDPPTNKHIKAKAEPLEHRVLVDHLRTALQLMCFSNFLGCFHPLRKITANLGSDILPWTMQIFKTAMPKVRRCT